MAGFVRTIEIRRPAAEVYATLTDFERGAPSYVGDLAACVIMPTTPGSEAGHGAPVGPGTRLSAVGATFAQNERIDIEVTAAEPGRRFEVRLVDPRASIVYSYTLEAIEANACRLTHEVRVRMRGLLRRLFTRFTLGMIRRADWAQVERIKFAVESAHARRGLGIPSHDSPAAA